MLTMIESAIKGKYNMVRVIKRELIYIAYKKEVSIAMRDYAAKVILF